LRALRNGSLSLGRGEESGLDWNRKFESGAAPNFRFHPDLAAATFDDFLAEGQSYAGSRDVPPMQSLQDSEYPLKVLGINADSIVANRE
jgi:hypothetical protein